MTENQGQGVSAFPTPPMQYVNVYNDDNIKRGRAPLPPPPISDNYMMFGAQFTADDAIIRPLEASNCRRLYPNNYDRKRELKKINHSILINFLDLLEVLIQSPESSKRQEKIEDMQILFINMHHLINEFRPHQARETLRVMMEIQKKKRLEIADCFQKHLDKVKELIEGSVNALPEDMDSKVLVTSELLQTKVVKAEPQSSYENCDRLDEMMTDIVDGMS